MLSGAQMVKYKNSEYEFSSVDVIKTKKSKARRTILGS